VATVSAVYDEISEMGSPKNDAYIHPGDPYSSNTYDLPNFKPSVDNFQPYQRLLEAKNGWE